jgi:hypothetical protein
MFKVQRLTLEDLEERATVMFEVQGSRFNVRRIGRKSR